LRDIEGEIVVAVDVSGGERDLRPLGPVADRVFEIEIDTFVESAITWLHEQCSAEWILRIDDDEVLDGRLLEQLPELIRARDVVQYWIARRWLYPDPAHWLEEWPWFPDFQGRLVRNDGRLWFSGLCHSGVELTLPARYLDSGLYHLAHLLSDRHERERKVESYRGIDSALRMTQADPYLSSYYVPERHPRARRVPVDPRDRSAIDALLASRGGGSSSEAALSRVQRVDRAEVQAHWAQRRFEVSGYAATIEPIDLYRRLGTRDHRPFRVRVRNDGTEWWPGGENRRPLVSLAYRWLSSERAVVEPEGHRTPLPHPLAPGESCLVDMNVTAPATAGRYLLAPDLVHEHVRWFESPSPCVEMLVTESNGESP
jgi:hypothetical protein